jgi:hypothetical protein
MNPPFGSVRSLEKSGPLINFFRIEEIDALHVRPQGEVQGCAESNSLRFTPLRQKLLSTDFSSLAHRVQGGFQNILIIFMR